MTIAAKIDQTLIRAIQYLAGVCDGAVTQDGHGFNGTDVGLGHWLAGQHPDHWDEDMAIAAYDMSRKYRRQLASAGIDFDTITRYAQVTPSAAKQAREKAQTTRATRNREQREAERRKAEAAKFVIDFVVGEWVLATPHYVPEIVEAARAIPTRRWDGRVNRFQGVPHRSDVVAGLKKIADEFDFNVTTTAQTLFDALAEDIANVEALPERRIEFMELDLDGKGAKPFFTVVSPRDFALIDDIKRKTTGRGWTPDIQRWRIAATTENIEDLLAIAKAHDLTVMPETQPHIDRLVAANRSAVAQRKILEKASNAKDADLEMPEDFGFTLMPFQRGGVAYTLNARRTFIADDMGTGKTIQALAAIEKAQAYPAVIVTPAAVKLKWLSEARKALPGKKVIALSGRTAKLETVLNADVIILNWDILPAWAGTKGVSRGKNKKPDNPGVLTRIKAKAVAYDESHYAKEQKAQRTRAAIILSEYIVAAHGDDALLLNLSGSPILNRPVELTPQLQIIHRLDDFGGFFKFAQRYCAAYKDPTTGFWNFSGSSNLDELNSKLRATCMVRRLKKDVLAELPPKRFSRVPAELTNAAEYRKAEADVIAWLQDSVEADQEFMASIAHLDDDERKAAMGRRRQEVSKGAEKAEELVRLNALRRTAAKGLVKPALEWIKDFVESSDEKLVVFAYHKDIQQMLLEGVREMADKGAGEGLAFATSIFAGEHGKGNDKVFQNDPQCRVVVASLTAAREGIDLFAASNVLMVERNWSPKTEEQAEDRIHRIGQQSDSATYWYMHPINPEENIYMWMDELLEAKRRVATAAIDGEVQERAMGESVTGGVVERLLAKGRA